jgi:hypothetical protein
MDADTTAEIAALRAEIAQLRMEMLQAQSGDMAGGEGVDVGIPLVPIGGDVQGAFRFEGNKITHCHFYAAHRIVELQDVSIGDGQADGTWYLNVDHDNLSGATVGKTAGANNDDNTSIKLFEIEDGAIKKDYRGMPFMPIYA